MSDVLNVSLLITLASANPTYHLTLFAEAFDFLSQK